MPRLTIHIPLYPSGVGSSHHTDPRAAVADILSRYWRMPFWPQLPNRSAQEMMLPQFGLGLPGASWDGDTLHWSGVCDDNALADADLPPPDRAAGFYEFIARLEAIDAAKRPPVVKGQMPGPLTMSMAMRDPAGAPPHADAEVLAWLGAFLGRLGALQARRLQQLVPDVVIVFDEPALAYVDEPSLPISWRDATAALKAALEPVQATGAIAGLHCCQPPNWSRALAARPNLVHFDAQEGRVDDLLEHRSALREHVARGGYLGWGLWPTDDPSQPFDPKEMQYFLARAARDLSFVDASVGLIFKRSMISGVCGAAGLSADQEARMADDLESLSMGIRKRYWIAATTDVDPDHPLT